MNIRRQHTTLRGRASRNRWEVDQQTDTRGANPRDIKLTVYEAHQRLSKRYALAKDGKTVVKESFTTLSSGGYRVAAVPSDDIPAALQVFGALFDALTYKQAISLGVPRDGSTAGLITTQDKVKDGTAPAGAIPRDLKHFGWPELALLFLDGDDRDGLFALLCGLYPPLAQVAALVRPSVSACVADPVTGKGLKTGEHVYLVIDKPERSRDCLHAIMRLAWVHGKGAAAGWLALSKRGDVLIRGPIDAVVGSPERLSYEGAGKLERGLKALPRVSRVIGGSGMLDADALIAYADQHAPEQRFRELVAAAKTDPAFVAACAAVKADYRATHIKKGAAQRLKKDPSLTPEAAEAQAAESFDATEAVGTRDANGRTWIPLADDHVLYWPDGKEFTVADIKADPAKFNDKECCDPAEGMDYQSQQLRDDLHQPGRSDSRFTQGHTATLLPMSRRSTVTPWAELFARITGVQTVRGIATPAFSEDAIALDIHGAAPRRGALHGEVGQVAPMGRTTLGRGPQAQGLRHGADALPRGRDAARRATRKRSPATRPRRACWGWPWTTSARRRWWSNGTPNLAAVHAGRHGRFEDRQDAAGAAVRLLHDDDGGRTGRCLSALAWISSTRSPAAIRN